MEEPMPRAPRGRTPVAAVILLAALIGGGVSAWRPPAKGGQTSTRVIHASPGDNLQAKVDSAGPGDVVRLSAGTYVYDDAGSLIVLRAKDSIRVAGEGPATVLRLGPRVRMGIEIQDSVHNVRIDSLAIVGAGTAMETNTHGVASGSGTTEVRNVTIADLHIREVAVAISVATNSNGVYDSVTIARNVIEHARGTEAGTGYGINNQFGTHVRIVDNEVRFAERHAIYQAESRGPADVIIEGNLIYQGGGNENHPRTGALAIARSQTVAVVNNLIVATRAPSPAVTVEWCDPSSTWCETSHQVTANILFIANRIIGSRGPDIYLTDPGPHTWWGNVIARPSPERGNEICRYQYHGAGPETSCGAPPNPQLVTPTAWTNTQGIVAGKGHLYVMHEGRLYEVTPRYYTDPDRWRADSLYRVSPTTWAPNFQALAADTSGDIFVMQNDRLHRVEPAEWRYTYEPSVVWRPFRALASLRGKAYVIGRAGGHLMKVDASTWTSETDDVDWSGVRSLAAWGGYLYALQRNCLYRIEPQTLAREVVSC